MVNKKWLDKYLNVLEQNYIDQSQNEIIGDTSLLEISSSSDSKEVNECKIKSKLSELNYTSY